MQGSALSLIFLPALVVIMLGLGLSLTVRDFRKVMEAPRAVIVALVLQTVLLPLVCLGVVYAFSLEAALAIGMMLLAASPGGTSSTLYSHLAGGDLALNITLTAINSVLAIVTMPLIANLSLAHFLEGDQAIPLQFTKMMQVFVAVIGPMLVGMWLRHRFPGLVDRAERPVKILSLLFLVGAVLGALIQEWQTVLAWGPVVGLAALTFNIISLAVGFVGPRLAGVERRQAISIGLEIGVHNAVLAMAIALSPTLLNNPTMAMPGAIYGLLAYVTAGVFVYLLRRVPDAADEQTTRRVAG